MIPNLSHLVFTNAKRKDRADDIHTVGPQLDSTGISKFLYCITEPTGLKSLLQRFVDAHINEIDKLKNIPNWNIWKDVMTTNRTINLRVDVDDRGIPIPLCTVNGHIEWKMHLKSLGRWDEYTKEEAWHNERMFFQTVELNLIYKTSDDGKNSYWTTSFDISDIGCVLCRFRIILGNRAFWCNDLNLTFPIVAYAKRESTETTVPTAVQWHQDRDPQRDGALLNLIRSTSNNGSSTEVLWSSPDDTTAEIIKCDPFLQNRTAIFNGNWYHRAPKQGGSREFLQVDLQDKESNHTFVELFLKWISSNYTLSKP